MPDRSYLNWPFFEPGHRDIAGKAAEWAAAHVPGLIDHADVDATCRALVRALGEAGLLAHAVPAAYGGVRDTLEVRTLCLIRETLAYQHGLADFAFANAMTKRMLHMEWDMGIDQAIEAEAMAQAVCMQTRDFRRAFEAFAAKKTPVFEGD